jgi:hypothetical protein
VVTHDTGPFRPWGTNSRGPKIGPEKQAYRKQTYG